MTWAVPAGLELDAEPNGPAIDLQILLMVTNSATLFLDSQLNVERFTPKVTELFNIAPSDQGRPLTYLAGRLGFAELVDDALEVLTSLVYIERELRSERDRWFLTRLVPYRTINGKASGVIITFVDITHAKETEARLRQSQQLIESLQVKIEAVVAEQAEHVRRLASEVLITEQKVQQSVSRILHDELQQVLFSIQMQVDMIHQMLPPDEQLLRARVKELRGAADLALHVTRRVVVDLTPPLMLGENFVDSLKWLAMLMKERYGLEVELHGTLRPGRPGDEVSMLLIQTVRELLFNVVKHAGVLQARVEVCEELDRLSLTVSDQGRGFDSAASARQRRSLGLFSIRNRLELFGGQFQIDSQVGHGTRATVVVLV